MKSVLVIEKDETTQAMLRSLLTLQWPDLAVLTAEDGSKGLRLAHEMRPDLILLECELPPGLDSFQTAKVLRHLPETQSIPLIALTHPRQTRTEKVIGLQDACHGWLTKPIVAAELYETISIIQMKRHVSV